MNDPYDMGLNELGQRVQAMSDPARSQAANQEANQRQQPWASGPVPVPASPAPTQRPAPSYENYSPTRNIAPRQEPQIPMHEQPQYQQLPQQAPGLPQQPQPLPAAPPDDEPRNGLQRAVAAVKAALPFFQKLLPLLDGNVVTAVTSLLTPMMTQQVRHTPPPPPVKIDLEPMERGLAELRAGQRELHNPVADQVTAMKRVEDQLERVREATDRNTLEQQEMVEDLRAVGNRVSTLAIAGVVLLAVSLGLNIYLVLQLQHLLH